LGIHGGLVFYKYKEFWNREQGVKKEAIDVLAS